jgi:hypothetical protein
LRNFEAKSPAPPSPSRTTVADATGSLRGGSKREESSEGEKSSKTAGEKTLPQPSLRGGQDGGGSGGGGGGGGREGGGGGGGGGSSKQRRDTRDRGGADREDWNDKEEEAVEGEEKLEEDVATILKN